MVSANWETVNQTLAAAEDPARGNSGVFVGSYPEAPNNTRAYLLVHPADNPPDRKHRFTAVVIDSIEVHQDGMGVTPSLMTAGKLKEETGFDYAAYCQTTERNYSGEDMDTVFESVTVGQVAQLADMVQGIAEARYARHEAAQAANVVMGSFVNEKGLNGPGMQPS